MSTTILATKLYIPRPRSRIVLRPRLIERLNQGLSSGRKLALISASAGFGKTTLVSEWIANCERPVAWLSLDERDNDPSRFLTYLVAALQTIAFLIGSGYAPVFTVRDGRGTEVFSGPMPALPQDANFTSTTVIKAPDAKPDQLGFNVTVAPTAPDQVDPQTGPASTFPEDDDPRVYLGAWTGDLGLDSGIPQNVYQLDTSDLKQLGREELGVGETWELPGGRGSVTFDGLAEFANIQVASDPGRWVALWAVVAAIIGVSLSLLVHRRRVWVRARPDGEGRTLVEVAGLAQTEWAGLAGEVDEVAGELSGVTNPERESV